MRNSISLVTVMVALFICNINAAMNEAPNVVNRASNRVRAVHHLEKTSEELDAATAATIDTNERFKTAKQRYESNNYRRDRSTRFVKEQDEASYEKWARDIGRSNLIPDPLFDSRDDFLAYKKKFEDKLRPAEP